MMRNIQESEIARVIQDQWYKLKGVRARAEANRALSPNHPRYKNQYRRDIGRGIVVVAISLAGTFGVVGSSFGLESRSEKRAEESCVPIRCKENLIALDLQQGINPNTDNRVASALSYQQVKEANDQTYWYEDRLPIAVGLGIAIPANILAGLYLIKPYLNHRKRLTVKDQQKVQS